MIEVGLHYVTLGRSSDTLSGGEAAKKHSFQSSWAPALLEFDHVLDESHHRTSSVG